MEPFRGRMTQYRERNTFISEDHTTDDNSEVMHYKQIRLNTTGVFKP